MEYVLTLRQLLPGHHQHKLANTHRIFLKAECRLRVYADRLDRPAACFPVDLIILPGALLHHDANR